MQPAQITQILNKSKIDSETWDQILPIVYNQLKAIARNVKFGHKKQEHLNTTSLVHEAFLKIQKHQSLSISGTKHFYRLAAVAMRQILVDTARLNLAQKRVNLDSENQDQDDIVEFNNQITSSHEIVEIDKALSSLEKLNPRLADMVIYHFYGGYTYDQIAEMLNVSKKTIFRDWKKAKAFIYAQLK